jgi:D-sedoheptulose 7-phosphate isomerase
MMKELLELTKSEIEEAISIKQKIFEDHTLLQEIVSIVTVCALALQNGNKILCIGNGGSAADAQHIAAEFVSRFYFDRPSLAAIALTTDTSAITAISNDYGYENLFSRQIEGLGNQNDVLFAISTSGNSPNILKGMQVAQQKSIKVVAFTSIKDQNMKQYSNFYLPVPSVSTPRIQEAHILFGHIICGLVEQAIFKS